MGVYMGIVTLDGVDHPEFPVDKFSGISEMIDLMSSVPMRKSREPTCTDPDYIFQPIDRVAFADQLVPKINNDLWRLFVEILSSDEKYWISISY